MYQMTDDEFEAAIDEALEGLPPRFLKALDNVGIAMEDEPDEDQLEMAEYGTEDQASGELLGLYDGIPLTERGEGYGEFGTDLPDFITIFKGPHERAFGSREQVVEEIKKTVVHEIGHYFGMDEEDLARVGLALWFSLKRLIVYSEGLQTLVPVQVRGIHWRVDIPHPHDPTTKGSNP